MLLAYIALAGLGVYILRSALNIELRGSEVAQVIYIAAHWLAGAGLAILASRRAA
jgi:hypothetical protein